MNKLIIYIKKQSESFYFPFKILVLLMILIHAVINVNYGDDLSFSKVLLQNNIFEWTVSRYNTWSSRNIIEFIMVIVLSKNSIVWRIIDICMILLLAVSISKILVKDNLKRNNWIITGLILLYPFNDMSTAGWGATTINYLWPLALGMYSIIVIKKILGNINIRWYEYVFSVFALLFAINIEPLCGILLVVNIICLSYNFYKRRRINCCLLFNSIICSINTIVILICPGNSKRNITEMVRYFNDFDKLSFLKKFELGFSSSMAKFLFEPNIVFFVFSMILMILIHLKSKDKIIKLISIIPFVSHIFLGIICFGVSKIYPNIPNIVKSISKYGIINLDNYNRISSYIPLIIIIIIGICTLISVYFCFDNKEKSSTCLFIMLLGLASRVIMGFSPTIWASNDRTFIFMYFSIIVVTFLLYNEFYLCKYKELKKIDRIIILLAILSFSKNILYALILSIFKNKENLIEFIQNIIQK